MPHPQATQPLPISIEFFPPNTPVGSDKLKTVVQTVALAMMVLPLRLLDGAWNIVGTGLWWVAVATMAVAVAITIVTGLDYLVEMVRELRKAKAADAERAG